MPKAIAVQIPYANKITFAPGGCIHWPNTNKTLLNAWVKRLKEPNVYGFLTGDVFDFARGKLRQHVLSYKADETSIEGVDEMVKSTVGELVAVLNPVKKKILGAVKGNHYWTFMDGSTSDNYLCQRLGIPFLGDLGLVRLDFKQKDGTHMTFVVYLHHSGGSSGGRTHGGDMNVLARQELVSCADMYVLSHTHDTYGKKIPHYVVNNRGVPMVLKKDRVFVRAGCMMNEAPYADKKAYPPKADGWVEVEVRFARTRNNQPIERWIKVSF